jgi:GTPase SAR1 family protein
MKIGFVGSQGTGKTSLAEELMRREYFKNYVFSPSSSRRLSSRLGINQSASPFSQLAITVARVADEDRSSNYGRKDTLSDRTPLDSMAYTRYQRTNVWPEDDVEADICMEVSEGLVRRAMRDFDTIVYFPVYPWGISDDGVRKTDLDYQREIAVNCMMYLTRFGITPYIVQDEPVDKRADHMVRWLERRM